MAEAWKGHTWRYPGFLQEAWLAARGPAPDTEARERSCRPP